MKLNKLISLFSLPLMVACGSNDTEHVGQLQQELVSNQLAVPAFMTADVSASECQNSPGPQITLNGVWTLGELRVQLVFTNNKKGTHTHTEESVVTLSVLDGKDEIVIPKQPVLGGVGGNPWVFIQLVDGNDVPLGEETLLGRCVQGLNNADLDFGAPGMADAWLTELSCSNSPGPFINVDGLLVMTGVKVRIIFRNNLIGTHETDVVQELTLMQSGTSFEFPKQPPLGGVGGNPHIYLRYVDSDDNVLAESYLGRCNQLSKKL